MRLKKYLLVDRSVCTGCRYCEVICSSYHSKGEVNPKKSRIRVFSNTLDGIDNPIICKQCGKAPCQEACPTQAIVVNTKMRIPQIIYSKCIKCHACVEACPFKAMFIDPDTEFPLKCDLCGGDPQCVKFCRALPHTGYSALEFSSIDEWHRKRIK